MLPEACRLKVHLQMPLVCNMEPPCPYCGIYKSLYHTEDTPPLFDVRRWWPALSGLSQMRGPLHISCLHGEPFADFGLMRVLGRLSPHNLIDCFSNMLKAREVITETFEKTSNLWLTCSFHPHHWADVASFIRKVDGVRALGVKCDSVFLVAFPPNLDKIDGWTTELSAANLVPYVMPFTGIYDRKTHPSAYSAEERVIVRRYLSERFGRDDFLRSREGTLCRAGMDIVFVGPDGDVVSCPGTRTYDLGNLLDGTFRPLDKPRPCLSSVCQCPDLWQLNEVQ